MSATILQLPGTAALVERPGLNLSAEEVQEAAGGYVYPARQLRELHDRGYVLATMGKNGRVVLPRAHYAAVNRGEFQPPAASQEPQSPAPRPNLAGVARLLGQKRRK